MNYFTSTILVPFILNNGTIFIPTHFHDADNYIIGMDLTLPLDPIYSEEHIDIFNDGGFYLSTKGKTFPFPET
jgi:Tfp pilus assembly protein PilZ